MSERAGLKRQRSRDHALLIGQVTFAVQTLLIGRVLRHRQGFEPASFPTPGQRPEMKHLGALERQGSESSRRIGTKMIGSSERTQLWRVPLFKFMSATNRVPAEHPAGPELRRREVMRSEQHAAPPISPQALARRSGPAQMQLLTPIPPTEAEHC